MTCYAPLKAWYDGVSRPSFGGPTIHPDSKPVLLPCGRCDGCELESSRQWSVRVMHEASLHDESCFVTLTYDDAHLPEMGSLNPLHLSKLWRDMRKAGHSIRYFACGEYGGRTLRPHYHAAIFGFSPVDRVLDLVSGQSNLYSSLYFSRFWPYGAAYFGDLNSSSAAYIARYVWKKHDNSSCAKHGKPLGSSLSLNRFTSSGVNKDADVFVSSPYERVALDTGEVDTVIPEFIRMSTKPGIGHGWISKFGATDVFNHDRVVVDAYESRPPRYYDKFLEKVDPVKFEANKLRRLDKMYQNYKEMSSSRLTVRGVVKKAAIKKLKERNL